MRSEQRIEERLDALRAAGLYRDPLQAQREAERGKGGQGELDARSNDYLGFAGSFVSRETGLPAERGVSRETGVVPVGAGASRLVSGTSREHVELEAALADWLRKDACLLFSSAYSANLGTVCALAVQGDVVLSDALNHASIIDGCRLSRATVEIIPHRDIDAYGRRLAAHAAGHGTTWVVTESYFSMDGTSPDFGALRELCDAHDAALIVDEAHALGVFGPEGRGLAAEAGVEADVLVGGFGKAFGLQGGFVASSLAVQRWLWNRARSFVFSTGLSPWLCARAQTHLGQIRQAGPQRERLVALSARLESALRGAGLELPPGRHGPIFPVLYGSSGAALDAAAALRPLGVLAQAIRPPTVPEGTARLRVTLRANMTDAEVNHLASALTQTWSAGAAERVSGATAPVEPSRASDTPEAVESDRTAPVDAGGRWVVLGTGTGVGKTYVAEAMVRAWAAAGRPVAGLKPIETGFRTTGDGQPLEGDAARLEAASFHVKHPRPHPLYGLRAPLTPSLAARLEGDVIHLEAVASWADRVRSPVSESPTLVVETAGGVFSPLTDRLTNFDLALCLGTARWVLVTIDRLGVLHDVASTLRAMHGLGRSPDLLVLNAPRDADASTGTNAEELRRLGVRIPTLVLGRDAAWTLNAPLGILPRL